MAQVLLRVKATERWFIFPLPLNSVSALPWEIKKVIIYNKIVELLQRETTDFISLKLWPPNSLDQNPVDYKIWVIMQKRVYEMQIHNVDKLKRRLVDVWIERSAAKCCCRCCQRVEKASAGVCSHEGRTFRTPAVGCFDNGMKLSIDSPCTTCY